MAKQRSSFADSAQAWRDPRFWEEVGDEVNVKTIRWDDFAAFISPAGEPEQPDTGFQDQLREHLRQLVRRLYSS